MSTVLPMCPCARTREFCLTKGCKQDEAHWSFTTEGRERDRLRRVVYARNGQAVSNWVRPERAVAEAWRLNMEPRRSGHIFIEFMARFVVDTPGAR